MGLNCVTHEESQVFEAGGEDEIWLKALVSYNEAPPVVYEQIFEEKFVLESLCFNLVLVFFLITLFKMVRVLKFAPVQKVLSNKFEKHES